MAMTTGCPGGAHAAPAGAAQTQTNARKRTLAISIAVLLLCIVALIGTTFAWFTSTASNTGNRIQAGNLKVDLVMDKNASAGTTPVGTYESIAGGTGDIFKEATNATNSNVTLWEPGKTQVVYLGVKNDGTLALKYGILLDVTDNGLASALEYALIDGAKASDLSGVTDWETLKSKASKQGDVTAGVIAAAENGCLDEIAKGITGETDYFALAVHMKESAGNEFQGKDVAIDVKVTATQKDAENDGFGTNTYDAGLALPVSAQASVVTGVSTVINGYGSDGSLAAKATIPADAVSGASSIKMVINETTKPSDITIEAGSESFSLDVNFYKVDASGNETQITDFGSAVVNVDLSAQIPGGSVLDAVYHTHSGTSVAMEKAASAEEVTSGKYFYDSASKTLTIGSTTFSPFTIVCKELTADIIVTKGSDVTYYSVSDYVTEATAWNAGTGGNRNYWNYGEVITTAAYYGDDAIPTFNAAYVALSHAFTEASYGLGEVNTSIQICSDLDLQGADFLQLFTSAEEGGFPDYGPFFLPASAIPTVTLDLNGHTISIAAQNNDDGYDSIAVLNANLVITDSSSKGTGKIATALHENPCSEGNSCITVEGGTVLFTYDGESGAFSAAGDCVGTDWSNLVPGNIVLKGGTISYRYAKGSIGSKENPCTVQQYYDGKDKGEYNNMPIGIYFNTVSDNRLADGYTYVDNGDATMTIVPTS